MGPGQSPREAPERKSPRSSKDPEVYIAKKRPKADIHGAFLTQGMPMITFLSPEFWCCWFILEVDEGFAIPVVWDWLIKHVAQNENRVN